MMSKFNLGDALASVLGDVSKSDTIELIHITNLDADEANFYALSDIDSLVANIELVGLQQPLRVRPNPGMDGRYLIVSGHRRRQALWTLYEDDPERWSMVPCIVDRDEVSPAMQELRLIYGNLSTRKLSDADIGKQAERVQELLYQLKAEGVEFPGRMRDHVAEACQISATKLATLKVIRERLPEPFATAYNAGTMATDTAYRLAKLPPEAQTRLVEAKKTNPTASEVVRISALMDKGCLYRPTFTCPDGKPCGHGDAMLRHDAVEYDACKGETCCIECWQAKRGWSPCANMCSKAKAKRAEATAAEKQAKDAANRKEQRKRNRQMQRDAQRIMRAVDAAGLDDDDTLTMDYSSVKVSTIRAAANGDLPETGYASADRFEFKYGDDLKQSTKLLHCSADYLLGLTDELTPQAEAPAGWQTGDPQQTGLYAAKFADEMLDAPILQIARWNGQSWLFKSGGMTIDMPCAGWFKIPEV